MGHAGNKIDEVWLQISRRGSSERDEILQVARGGGLMYSTTQTGDLWPRGFLLESQNIEGCQNIFVTLFFNVVSPISMKFGMMGGGALGGSKS